MLFRSAGSCYVEAAQSVGVKLWEEVFADRRYTSEGYLVPRTESGALINDEDEAVQQALRMASNGEVLSIDQKLIKLQADTLCIHGDGPSALEFARKIRSLI